MLKKWKDIKIGDKLKDGSTVTQIHRTHSEDCCKIIYDNDKEFICAYRHVLLIDISNLPDKSELEYCSFVPLVEDLNITSNKDLTDSEKEIVEKFCRNENIDILVDCIYDDEIEIYDFHFNSEIKRIYIENVVIKSEPQKVDENTYWLTCKGIEYLMNKYKVDLYCNGNIINKIIPMGKLDCFCISTDTGRYET